MSTKNVNLVHVCDTLFNSFEDYADSATQLHIYAFKSKEEYDNATMIIGTPAETEYLAELGYHDDVIPCEPIPGSRFSSYSMEIIGDFLVVIELLTIDI